MPARSVRSRLPARTLAVLLGTILAVPAVAQQVVLQGAIQDAETGDALPSANVFLPDLGTGAVADVRGNYRLELPAGTHEARFSFIGYEPQVRTIELRSDTTVNVALVRRAELEQIDVVGRRDTAPDAPVLGITQIEIMELQRLPSFMGEVDVSRALLALPGVTSVGEGSGGLHVRGGEADQNLVLLDGMNVFFPSHLFGMFSAFNPDLLQSVTLYRGTIPARYGGRISSVVNVRQRDGRSDHLGVSAGIGLVASRLALEGPLWGDRVTALVGGRVSYVNWLIRLADRADLKASHAGYADLSGRLAIRPSDRLQVHVSGYLGTDNFRFGADTTYTYTSRSMSASAAYALAGPLTAHLDVAASEYDYGFRSDREGTGFAFDAAIEHWRVQPSIRWPLPAPVVSDLTVEAGLAVDRYRLWPARLDPLNPDVMQPVDLEREQGLDTSGFLSADIEWGRWRLDAGMRYSRWATLGPASVPIIDPLAPLGPGAILDTVMVPSGAVVAEFAGFEPRLGLRLALTDDLMLKAGFSRLRQNIHLLSNTTTPTPIARWKLSDPNLPSQIGDQVSAGLEAPLPFGLRLTAEGYYRWLENVPTYRPGASLLLNPFVTADLLTGDGRAYGAEILLERPHGMVTGRLSYTLSRTERRAFSERPEEQVNLGQYFPADFDRPHDLAVTVAYDESAWATWGVNFVYSSGRPLTFPTGVYDLGDLVVPSYTLRNQGRLPAYHRLDLSLTIDAPHNPTGRYRGRWNVTIYNVYGRRNAYSVFFRQRPGTRIPQAYRISTFGTIMPSISYSFEF